MLGSFGSCGSAIKFNNNTLVSYGEHSNYYNEIFFVHSGNSTFNEDTVIEYVGNVVTDYTYYHGAKNQKVFDKLCAINGVNIKELRICDNVYNCPNYSYSSPDDYMWICWVRSEAEIKDFICENNDLQGANVVYGAEGGENFLREFYAGAAPPQKTEIKILCNGAEYSEATEFEGIACLAVSGDEKVEWFTLENDASVENGTVEGKGEIIVFAAKTDGSGVFTKVTVKIASEKSYTTLIVCLIAALLLITATVITSVVLIKRRRNKLNV